MNNFFPFVFLFGIFCFGQSQGYIELPSMNLFTAMKLVKKNGALKIQYVMDTRRKDNCKK